MEYKGGDPDGRVIWDYPFGLGASLIQGATEDEVIEKELLTYGR